MADVMLTASCPPSPPAVLHLNDQLTSPGADPETSTVGRGGGGGGRELQRGEGGRELYRGGGGGGGESRELYRGVGGGVQFSQN